MIQNKKRGTLCDIISLSPGMNSEQNTEHSLAHSFSLSSQFFLISLLFRSQNNTDSKLHAIPFFKPPNQAIPKSSSTRAFHQTDSTPLSTSAGEMSDEKSSWLIYGFVARGTVVLAEYTEYTGNFAAIAARCLDKLPSSNNRFTYACDGHTFNFLVNDGYAYCVVAKESAPKHVSVAFLEREKADFKKRYGGGKADTALPKSLNKEFGPVIKEHMQYIIEHADEIEKLIKVKAQVSEVKSIMLDNIEKTMDRGEKLRDLEEKTTDLRNQAQDFKKQGTKVRKKMWLQNMKIKLVILGILLIFVFIIWMSICHGFDCTKHSGEENKHTPAEENEGPQ